VPKRAPAATPIAALKGFRPKRYKLRQPAAL